MGRGQMLTRDTSRRPSKLVGQEAPRGNFGVSAAVSTAGNWSALGRFAQLCLLSRSSVLVLSSPSLNTFDVLIGHLELSEFR